MKQIDYSISFSFGRLASVYAPFLNWIIQDNLCPSFLLSDFELQQ